MLRRAKGTPSYAVKYESRGIGYDENPFTTTTTTMAPDDVDYAGSITFMDIREELPMVDPENLSPQNVLEILLYLFQKKPGFIDRGHEINNRETAWVNAFLFRLKPDIDADGMECFVVETVGSSVDKMAELREKT